MQVTMLLVIEARIIVMSGDGCCEASTRLVCARRRRSALRYTVPNGGGLVAATMRASRDTMERSGVARW